MNKLLLISIVLCTPSWLDSFPCISRWIKNAVHSEVAHELSSACGIPSKTTQSEGEQCARIAADACAGICNYTIKLVPFSRAVSYIYRSAVGQMLRTHSPFTT